MSGITILNIYCQMYIDWNLRLDTFYEDMIAILLLQFLLFTRRTKKTSKLRVTGLCEWNSPVTGESPAQMASNAENVSIWWRHHVAILAKVSIRRNRSFNISEI